MVFSALVYRSLDQTGGDTVRAKAWLERDPDLAHQPCSVKTTLFGVKFLFGYILACLLRQRGTLIIPLTCYLAMLRLNPMALENVRKILSPRLCFLADRCPNLEMIDWVDFLPLSYSLAMRSRYIPAHLKPVYYLERLLYLNAYKKFGRIQGVMNVFISHRDSRCFIDDIGSPAEAWSHMPAKAVKVETAQLCKNTVLYVANFESVFNQAGLSLLREMVQSGPLAGYSVILSGRGGDEAVAAISDASWRFVAYEELTHGCAEFGFCVMPASAGQQNKIGDYVKLAIIPLLDKVSAEGIDCRINGDLICVDLAKGLDTASEVIALFKACERLEVSINAQ